MNPLNRPTNITNFSSLPQKQEHFKEKLALLKKSEIYPITFSRPLI
jgi:hypothetical protein